MAYSKLHSSLVNSSLWTEQDHVRILFITLLALCDKDGCVYGSRPGLERAACINLDAAEERNPWAVLMSPDPDSCDKMRAPENEGRRIEEIPGGFRLLNFEYYRGLRNDDDRAEQNRRAQEKHRQKLREQAEVSQGKPASAKVSRGKPPKAHTESEAEADSEKKKPMSANADVVAIFEYWQTVLNHPTAKLTPERLRSIESRLRDGYSPAQIKQAIDGCRNSPHHMGENDRNAVYDDLTLICRNGSKLEQFISYGAANGSKPFKSLPEPRNEIEFQKMLLNQEPK